MRRKGNTRTIDELGRIVVPIEFRNALNVKPGDFFDMELNGESIIISKVNPACTFCSSTEELISFEGKTVCKKCCEKISNL